MQKVAVVILNWNGVKHLKEFLPSVMRDYQRERDKIYVVDNASSDDSVDFLSHHYPDIGVIQNGGNGGYAKGYNEGLKHIEAEYYLLLNSDVETTPGWIDPLVAALDADPALAGCQPIIMDYRKKNYFEHAGAAGGYIDRFGYPFCRGRIFHVLEENKGQYHEPAEIFWATGACLAIRSELFHKAGGFDEDFFAHMEEIDLCWRLKNRGYIFSCVPSSQVYHLGGGTLSVISPSKTFLNFRNNLYLLYKNLPPVYLYKTIGIRFFLDLLAFLSFFMSGKFPHGIAVIRAWMAFFRNLSILRAKRIKLQETPAKDYISMVYLRSIVSAFFLHKKRTFSELDQKEFAR